MAKLDSLQSLAMAQTLRSTDLDSTLAAADKDAPFYHSLGKFICKYAIAESNIHYLFRHVSKIPDKTARAVIGGSTLFQVINLITRLLPAEEDRNDEQKEISCLLSHLQTISDFRNGLIHRGGETLEAGIESTNIFTAKSYESVEILVFPLGNLKDAIEDIEYITMRIYLILSPKAFAEAPADFIAGLFAPWRYKSVQPNRPHQRKRPKSPKPSRPRKPSRA